MKERIEREVLPRFSSRRQRNAQELMMHLYQNPVLNSKVVSKVLDIKINTASALVTDFESYGVLSELTGKQRNRLY